MCLTIIGCYILNLKIKFKTNPSPNLSTTATPFPSTLSGCQAVSHPHPFPTPSAGATHPSTQLRNSTLPHPLFEDPLIPTLPIFSNTLSPYPFTAPSTNLPRPRPRKTPTHFDIKPRFGDDSVRDRCAALQL